MPFVLLADPAPVSNLADIGETFATTAFSGAMVLAVPVALLAGFISFASPCVLPLVPGYLGFVSGLSAASMSGPVGRAGVPASSGRGRLVLGVGLFILGFTFVYVSIGILSGAIGSFLIERADILTTVLGVIVVFMGLTFLGAVPALQRERRVSISPTASLWGAPLLGLVFGLGWAPCMGPTLVAINALALTEGSAARGAVLAAAYCVGLGLPFLLIALGLQSTRRGVAFLARHRLAIMRVGGALLVLIGVALVTGLWGELSRSIQGWVSGTVTVV